MNVRKVLIIEDDSHVVQYLSSFIPLLGEYEVEISSNEIDALAKINAFEPALVILDMNTSHLNSERILQEVKDRHTRNRILLIAKKGEMNSPLVKGYEIVSNPSDLSEVSQHVKRILQSSGKKEKQTEYARLLLADDEPEINEFLKDELFSPLGIEVYTASNGEEALKVFKEKGCNIVVVDLKMPKMDGADLIRELEASDNPPKPKVIILITAGLGDRVEEIKRLGYPVISKPVDVIKLEKSILQACEKFKLALKK
ncbi:MAG: response regulator [Candidatus Omnitrophica bacterium]|nr:response regulator [Candidatus Omnitrophota bacterium]